ncbi:MAG: hypothetical protein AMQ22_00310 [Candidatus Methanofastidiosum methylothiophilum]|uniref:Uncharacterized protein n=1 Tax=Candidatus Methanofastidiosum methylothiophilum TaxID=1705564 RepID=A0A150J7V1_9EURY|nr:MAG: hypothetical protein AMQ22_00310 [Candidatus Methanofastidiosum methylthiophilus]
MSIFPFSLMKSEKEARFSLRGSGFLGKGSLASQFSFITLNPSFSINKGIYSEPAALQASIATVKLSLPRQSKSIF